jgi:LemA protein
MQQQLETKETEQATPPGYTPEEYREIVRRAQQIRADKEERLSPEALAESAAEVGIREEDLREAAQQLKEERAHYARRRALTRNIGIAVAAFLALFLVFSYNGLNSEYQDVQLARANLHSVLQRRAELIPQLESIAREGAAQEREVADRLARAQTGLRSGDVNEQLRASKELDRLLEQVKKDPRFRTGELYQTLQVQIEGSANRIAEYSRRYNQAVTEYNRAARSFPTSLARPIFGFPAQVRYLE